MTEQHPYISIVIPVKNERDNIEPLIEEIAGVFEKTEWEYEVMIIDDGSTDGTFDEIQRLHDQYPVLHVIQFERNYGQSSAMLAGMNEARGEIACTMDGDLQNDPADFPPMIRTLEEKSLAMVTGTRTKRHDTAFRQIQSRIANSIRNAVTGDDIVDSACAVRVFRRTCFFDIHTFNGMHRFLPTLFRMAGYRVEQMPVNHRHRKFGTAKYGLLNRVFKATGDLLVVRWLQKNTLRYTIKKKV